MKIEEWGKTGDQNCRLGRHRWSVSRLIDLAKDLPANLNKIVTTLIYFIDYKVVTTIRQERMSFGTFLDVNLDWVDTVHFPESLKNYPIKGRGFYKVTGKVVSDFGVYNIEVHKLYKIGYKERKYANL